MTKPHNSWFKINKINFKGFSLGFSNIFLKLFSFDLNSLFNSKIYFKQIFMNLVSGTRLENEKT